MLIALRGRVACVSGDGLLPLWHVRQVGLRRIGKTQLGLLIVVAGCAATVILTRAALIATTAAATATATTTAFAWLTAFAHGRVGALVRVHGWCLGVDLLLSAWGFVALTIFVAFTAATGSVAAFATLCAIIALRAFGARAALRALLLTVRVGSSIALHADGLWRHGLAIGAKAFALCTTLALALAFTATTTATTAAIAAVVAAFSTAFAARTTVATFWASVRACIGATASGAIAVAAATVLAIVWLGCWGCQRRLGRCRRLAGEQCFEPAEKAFFGGDHRVDCGGSTGGVGLCSVG